MMLRRFKPEGIDEFKALLARLRAGTDEEIPPDLLEHRGFTEIVEPQIQIVCEQLDTKGDAARYLRGVLSPLGEDEVRHDAGLWTWLTAMFFDSVCPFRNGVRKIRNDYYYIFEPHNARHSYRNLLFISWRVLQLAPNHNRLFLHSRLRILDKVTEQIMGRLFLTRIPCIFEVLDRLYWDTVSQRPRPGVTSAEPRAGDLRHRLPTRIRQLEKTFDLQILNADQLIDLLGDEFALAGEPVAMP